MSLAELRIENLRCVESAELEFSPELNLIAGENGAGKTSILEAIFLLGRGRSFRTRSSETAHPPWTGQRSPYSAVRTIRRPAGWNRNRRGWRHPGAYQRRERAIAARAVRRVARPGHRSGDPQAGGPGSGAPAALAGLAGVPRGTKLRLSTGAGTAGRSSNATRRCEAGPRIESPGTRSSSPTARRSPKRASGL